MRTTFINTLVEEAKKNDKIFVITPDMGFSVLERFGELFPDRLLNVGIAEQNAIGVAAGLALSGYIVYVYSITPFVTMRCFEQVRVDVAYMKTNVRLIGVGAGLSYGPAGSTHHAIEDVAIMRALPNMTVCCPGDPIEVREFVKQSVGYQGPMYIRLGKNGEPKIHDEQQMIRIGDVVKICHGEDLSILSMGNMLEQAQLWVDELKKAGKSASLYSVPTLKPFNKNEIIKIIKQGKPLVTMEEHNVIGGLGSAVSEVIAESGTAIKFKRIGIPDVYTHLVGDQKYLRENVIFNQKSANVLLEDLLD